MKAIWRGENLRVRRKHLGLKMKELADKVGCDRQLISMWEVNKATPSGHFLVVLLRVLNLQPEDLYEIRDILTDG